MSVYDCKLKRPLVKSLKAKNVKLSYDAKAKREVDVCVVYIVKRCEMSMPVEAIIIIERGISA